VQRLGGCGKIKSVKILAYVELKNGYDDNGPAWIAYLTPSKSGRTLYFNGRALMKLKGQRRGDSGGNYCDMETHESYWVSGVKKDRRDRHWAGAGKVLVEAAAVAEYLETTGASALDKSRFEVTRSIIATDVRKFEQLANMRLRGGPVGNDQPAGSESHHPDEQPRWDEQMDRDSSTGKLDFLFREAENESA
jgi:hypothetical protein